MRDDAARIWRRCRDNPSTWLLWNDPLLGILDPQVRNVKRLAGHHRKLAGELGEGGAGEEGVVGEGVAVSGA